MSGSRQPTEEEVRLRKELQKAGDDARSVLRDALLENERLSAEVLAQRDVVAAARRLINSTEKVRGYTDWPWPKAEYTGLIDALDDLDGKWSGPSLRRSGG
jgi:hypothetical protein